MGRGPGTAAPHGAGGAVGAVRLCAAATGQRSCFLAKLEGGPIPPRILCFPAELMEGGGCSVYPKSQMAVVCQAFLGTSWPITVGGGVRVRRGAEEHPSHLGDFWWGAPVGPHLCSGLLPAAPSPGGLLGWHRGQPVRRQRSPRRGPGSDPASQEQWVGSSLLPPLMEMAGGLPPPREVVLLSTGGSGKGSWQQSDGLATTSPGLFGAE